MSLFDLLAVFNVLCFMGFYRRFEQTLTAATT